MVQSGGYWEPQQPAHWVHSPCSSTLGRCPQHPLQEASHPLLEADPPSSSAPLGFCTYCSNLRVLPWHKQKAHWLLLIPWVGISSNVNMKKKKTLKKKGWLWSSKLVTHPSTQFKAALDSTLPTSHDQENSRAYQGGTSSALPQFPSMQASGAYVSDRPGLECCSNKQPPDLSGWKQRWAFIGLAKKFGNLLRKWTWGQSNISCWYYTSAGDQPRWQVCVGEWRYYAVSTFRVHSEPPGDQPSEGFYH